MGTKRGVVPGLPKGELPVVVKGVSAGPVVADTFAGRVHVEWGGGAAGKPLWRPPVFIGKPQPSGVLVGLGGGCPPFYPQPKRAQKSRYTRPGFRAGRT